MSDFYHRDTKKAMEAFDQVKEDLTDILAPGLIETMETFLSEVDGLLDQYDSKLDDVESLTERLAEIED